MADRADVRSDAQLHPCAGSKWRGYELLYPRIIGFLVFLFNLNVIFGAVLLITGGISTVYFFIALFAKISADFLFVSTIGHFLKRPSSSILFILADLFYSIYVIIFGLAGLFGNYTWKGRPSKYAIEI